MVADAAVKYGFFFLARASEYVKSSYLDLAKIVRGVDVAFVKEEGQERAGSGADRIDVQFRKTKVDQMAFGCTRTHYRLADKDQDMCVVRALEEVKNLFPEDSLARRKICLSLGGAAGS